MKITKEYLRRIIKEELRRSMNENKIPVEAEHLLRDLIDNGGVETAKMLIDAGIKLGAEYELEPTDGTKQAFNLFPRGQVEGMPINAGKGFIQRKNLKSVVVQ